MKTVKKGTKVKYIGPDNVAYTPGKIYTVLDIDSELGWYEVHTDVLNDDFVLPPEHFEVLED